MADEIIPILSPRLYRSNRWHFVAWMCFTSKNITRISVIVPHPEEMGDESLFVPSLLYTLFALEPYFHHHNLSMFQSVYIHLAGMKENTLITQHFPSMIVIRMWHDYVRCPRTYNMHLYCQSSYYSSAPICPLYNCRPKYICIQTKWVAAHH